MSMCKGVLGFNDFIDEIGNKVNTLVIEKIKKVTNDEEVKAINFYHIKTDQYYSDEQIIFQVTYRVLFVDEGYDPALVEILGRINEEGEIKILKSRVLP